MGGDVGIVDDCDPNKWSKVEIESICKDFGYISVSRLWYKMPSDNEEGRKFHLINDDHDEMLMTDLVRGHGQIHVYVEHPVHEPILINVGNGVTLDLIIEPKDVEPLDVSKLNGYTSSESELAYDGYYNGQVYFCSSGSNDDAEYYDGDDDFDGHQYFYEGYKDGGSNDDDEFYDGDDDFYGHQYFYEGDRDDRDGGVDDKGGCDGGHDEGGMGVGDSDGNFDCEGHAPTNVDGNQSDSNVKVLGCRKPGKELVVEEPQEDGTVTTDSNDSDEDSDVEEARQMNPNQRYG